MANNPDYIQIRSIEDVDPNKIPISHVGKKYIDKDKNRYIVKFNKDLRKIELAQVFAKGGAEEVIISSSQTGTRPKSAHEILEKIENKPEKPLDFSDKGTVADNPFEPSYLEKFTPKPLPSLGSSKKLASPSHAPPKSIELEAYDLDIFDNPSSSKKPGSSGGDSPIPDGIFNSKSQENLEFTQLSFVPDLFKSIDLQKTRISSVLNNLKTSKIFELTGDPSQNGDLVGNLIREFHQEIFQKIEKLHNFHKELTAFPRPAGYYSSSYSAGRKAELKGIMDEKEQIQLVHKWETQDGFTDILKSAKKMVMNLMTILNQKTEDDIRHVPFQQQQLFQDAKTATLFVTQELDKMIRKIDAWKLSNN